MGLDSGEAETDQRHLRREAELLGDVRGGEHASGRAVVDAGRVPRGHPAVGAERGLQTGEPRHRGVRAGWFVRCHQLPAAFGVPARDRDQIRLDPAVRVCLGHLLLGRERVRVRPRFCDLRVAVVDVLRGLPHDQRG